MVGGSAMVGPGDALPIIICGKCKKHVGMRVAPMLDLALVPARCAECYAAPRNGQEVRHWQKR
jgi:hypothetical protein